MTPFTTVTGIAAPIVRDDVNTDAVIPVAWMKHLEPDYARALFGNWRWVDGDGVREIPEFVLNRMPFRDARILVAGNNFGCGSAREAAALALLGFGIRCVIAAGFSDIFTENALRNGLLPITLPKETVTRLQAALVPGLNCTMSVDLEKCEITAPDGEVLPFTIAPVRRQALLTGLDEIGLTLLDLPAIDAFQQRDRQARPWIYQPALNSAMPGDNA